MVFRAKGTLKICPTSHKGGQIYKLSTITNVLKAFYLIVWYLLDFSIVPFKKKEDEPDNYKT